MENDVHRSIDGIAGAGQRSVDLPGSSLSRNIPPGSVAAGGNAAPSPTPRARLKAATPPADEEVNFILEHRSDPYVEPRDRDVSGENVNGVGKRRTITEVSEKIRSNPWRAVGVAAAVGFLFGRIH